MKRKKIFIYLLSGLIPLAIFLASAFINGLVPFGNDILNVYDSFSQYPSMLLGLKNALINGNIFYSFGVGLGFNLFGTLAYYAMSPLNVFALFANSVNYPYFIANMTYLRIALLGLSMCFYLDKRGTKGVHTVIFSTLFALMGYTSTYYYNFMWIDAIIALPFVIHGLDKLIDENKPLFYIISLAVAIIINFYIGYMICIFCLLYFIYRMIIKMDKKVIKTFIISSLLAGLISSVILLPTVFALLNGKASLYESVSYGGISKNGITFFLKLLSGNYERGDQQVFFPCLIYSGIISLVLVIFSFFNKNISKREKIANGCMLLLFYASFTVNALNYAWQMFQHPIWWESRFAFLFSFFMIITALKSLERIDGLDFKLSKRLIVTIVFIILFSLGLYFKVVPIGDRSLFIYIFFGFSILLFIEFMFLADKKIFMPLLIVFTLLDLSINTYNSLKQNNIHEKTIFYKTFKETMPKDVSQLNEINNGEFYRLELADDYTSDDGLYFNYNGINYFNSVRNVGVVRALKYLGLTVTDDCHVQMKTFDPLFLSLFNVKYIYGSIDYFEKKGNFSENPYPLALGFRSESSIKNVKLIEDEKKSKENLSRIINGIMGYDVNLIKHYDASNFKKDENVLENSNLFYLEGDKDGYVSYEFIADKDYLLMPVDEYVRVTIGDGEASSFNYYLVNKGEKVSIKYNILGKVKKNKIYFDLMDYDKYKSIMEKLENNLMSARAFKNGHIIDGSIDMSEPGYLFTSIEYEEGMEVFVDDEKVEIDKILGTLVGFELDEGEHKIYINYIPKGVKMGSILSFIGIIISVVYLQIHKKHI